ncbi:TlpA disulfide reductase family protein [Alkalihalobacillus sp. AL-G]|uniref:TlpA disulfide reductase family protein n=1 Tax=Alkalihalobacillus sp. AL-G TaxID=2926399 RepID=UPI00272975B6|nr:TlpA disulfide reductase family protein [Alkalihalobacillus sp. AL-G]WLD92722.1 TlpA family protein disulfide reductase [Alkalihalobacillus sp. AL-G]
MEQTLSFCLKKHASEERVCLEDFKGKPVLLQFWVSWCPDCMREVPLLEQFYRSISNNEFVTLTINVTGREGTKGQRDAFISNLSMTVPVLLDEGTSVYDQYECTSVPTTILLNTNHDIVGRFTDDHRFQDVLYGISRLLTS